MFQTAIRQVGVIGTLFLVTAAPVWSQTGCVTSVDPCRRGPQGATLRMTYGGRIYYSFPQYDVFVAGAPANLDEFITGEGTGTGVVMRNDFGMRWDGRNLFYHPAYPAELVTRYQYRNRPVESMAGAPLVMQPQVIPAYPPYRTAYQWPAPSTTVTTVPPSTVMDAPRYIAPPLPGPSYQPLPYQPPSYPENQSATPTDEESMEPNPSTEAGTAQVPRPNTTSGTATTSIPIKCQTYARFDPECSPWRTP